MGVRDELKGMAQGFRWGRRPVVPRDAEPYVRERPDAGFPTDWARSDAGVAARQLILNAGMKTIIKSELSLRVYGADDLSAVRGPVIFYSNHSSHLDATLIMSTLPDRFQRRTAVGAARDYFFDVWWRQAFTALVYAGFPIDRGRGGAGSIDKARQIVQEGWSIVVFPEGTRSRDGHLQRFRHGASRLALELGVSVVPVAIDRRLPGDAEGRVVAARGASTRDDPLRPRADPGAGGDAPVLVAPDAAGCRPALR